MVLFKIKKKSEQIKKDKNLIVYYENLLIDQILQTYRK